MSKDTRIGALWKPNTSNEKAPFAKGKITVSGVEYPVVVWSNRWKHEGERTPDFYVDLDDYKPESKPVQGELTAEQVASVARGHEPRPGSSDAVRKSAENWQASRPKTTSTMQTRDGEEFQDEIPF